MRLTPPTAAKILILGSGPNRIGQGIEFDYCCCQAAFALSEMGFETIMLNCNPETVSTDYDTADRLYFEPLTLEHVLNVIEREQPEGVIVQFGGQTPLNLADGLEAAGVHDSRHLARGHPPCGRPRAFAKLLETAGHPAARKWHRHVACRRRAPSPSASVIRCWCARRLCWAGGRWRSSPARSNSRSSWRTRSRRLPAQPMLIDRFMEDAFEIDVDALADGERVVIGAIMQHIEEAGVHSGDSACVLPPYKVSAYHLNIMREYTEQLGLALGVRGLMNVQFAIKDDIVYVLEVNPRASRTVPYASKATGLQSGVRRPRR